MELTTEGIIFLASAWVIIFTLVIYCFSKVLKSERKKNNTGDA
jgi:hypothetical protein